MLIEGHTDNVGSESYNLDLSHRRADAVRDFLSQNGVNTAQIATRGYGKRRRSPRMTRRRDGSKIDVLS